MSRFIHLSIDEIKDETPEAYTIFFQSSDEAAIHYLPGQYLTIKVEINGQAYRRAYSLSSSPLVDDRMSVTIKRVNGGVVSNYLRDQLTAGEYLDILPPMGHFIVDPDPERALHYVLIGGGSGITPLISILKSILEGEPNSKASLWLGNRSREDIIFRKQLADLSNKHAERLHVYHTLSRSGKDWKGPEGRLDTQRIYDLTSELFMTDELRKRYYLCGPEGLMNAAEEALDKHAVHPADVFRELFSAPVPTEAEVEAAYASPKAEEEPTDSHLLFDGESTYDIVSRSALVTLGGETRKIEVEGGKTVLGAANDAGLDPPYSCQAGICSTCRAKLLSGVVAMDEHTGLSTAELEEGYVLTCQCHVLSDDVELEYED